MTVQAMFNLPEREAKRLGFIVSDPYQPANRTSDPALKKLGLIEFFDGTYKGMVPTVKLEKILDQCVKVYE
jgi:hypothetical protein